MRVLLVSTYELGHQPLHVAAPAAALRSHGHDVRCEDLSVSRWSAASVDWAEAIGFSVPMHTAMRMGVQAAHAARRRRPATPICFYGLYAPLSENGALAGLADHILGGEYEPGLVEWVDGLAPHPARAPAAAAMQAVAPPPARGLLPPLDAYAHLAMAGEHVPVGYVETSRGCVHKCRHCPVPVEYDGRIRVVEQGPRVERHRAAGGDGCAAHHVRGSGLSQRGAPLSASRARDAPAVPRPDIRLHGQGRAHSRARGHMAGDGVLRVPLRRGRPSRA